MNTRVLIVSQPTTGGTAVVVRQVAESLAGRGFDVTVAAPADGELRRWLVGRPVDWQTIPMRRRPGWSDLRAVLAVRRLARHADVLHLHSSKAGAVGRLAMIGLRERPRVIFTPHAWSWNAGKAAAKLYSAFERWAVRYCDLITVTSREERDDGRVSLGARPRMQVIENGVDTNRFSPDGPMADRTSAPLLVCVGRLSRQKGQDRLISVLALHLPECRLRLVGTGEEETGLRQLAADLGVTDRVDFIGSADPRPHYRSADVVVSASRWEGMSLVVLEAMACGAAVVSTDCGGSSALDGGAGIVVRIPSEAEAVAALGAALHRALGEPDTLAALRVVSRTQATTRFALERVIKDFRAAYVPQHHTTSPTTARRAA